MHGNKFPLSSFSFPKLSGGMVYPAALYSYYKMYTGRRAEENLAFAQEGFKRALEEIIANDKDLLILNQTSSKTDDFVLQIGKKCLIQNKQGEEIPQV